MEYISRAGEKIDFAIKQFEIDVQDKICADLGSSTGGFTGALLQHGAKKVYSIDTAYGELDWKLRNDSRVVVMERTNALYVQLPEKIDIIVIDVGWTKQKMIIPKALTLLSDDGVIISLVKLHYEAEKYMLQKGKLKEEYIDEVIANVESDLSKITDIKVINKVRSPVLGKQAKNIEYLFKIVKI